MKSVLFSLALCVVLILPVFASDSESPAHQTTHPAQLPTLEIARTTDGNFSNEAILIPLWKGFLVEGVRYYSQGRNIGFGGVGYAFRPHNTVILVPSLYGVRGNTEHDRFALGFRAIVEAEWVMADISVIRAFGGRKGEDRDLFMDPSHVSIRLPRVKRFGRPQIGYAGEFFRHIGESHVAETHPGVKIAHGLARAATVSTPSHKTDEWPHGPRVGWEFDKWIHISYSRLNNGKTEHKITTSFFFADLLRKKK